jgi:hypothetical protein
MNRKRTLLLPFFLIASVTAIIVRYYQFAGEIIDFDTGFFVSHAGFASSIYYLILGIVFIGLIVLSIAEKKYRTRFFNKRMGHFDETDLASSGIMLLLAAFAIIYMAVADGLSKLGIVEIITAIIGALAYSFAGGVLLFRKRTYPSVGFAFLVLAVYYLIRLIIIFLSNHIILNMTEQLMMLIFTVTLALFYLSFGRMFIRAESKTTRIKAYIFGTFAAIAATAEISAKTIYWLGTPSVTRDNLRREASEFIMPDMLIAAETIALIALLLCMIRYKKVDS